MSAIDITTPFDELTELRSVLTTGQIAEMTGLRRETISRARPDSRFHERTEKALRDLYIVVSRMRAADEGKPGQLAAVLRKLQPSLTGRSIAELLREGRVDEILEHLDPPISSEEERLENLELDPKVLEQLAASSEDQDHHGGVDLAEQEERVAAMLADDFELAGVLPPIEATIREVFGNEAQIVRAVVTDHEDPDGRDRLYLRIRSALSFDEEIDRLAELFDREDGRLAPVDDRLTIGNL